MGVNMKFDCKLQLTHIIFFNTHQKGFGPIRNCKCMAFIILVEPNIYAIKIGLKY